MSKIHPTAQIGKNSSIDDSVTIGERCVIGDNVTIMANTYIHQNTTIGDNSVIHPSVVIGADPHITNYTRHYDDGVVIGKHANIREFTSIDAGSARENHLTRVGDYIAVHSFATIAHDAIVGNHVSIMPFCGVAGHAHIGDYSALYPATVMLPFVRVGKACFIRPYSFVDRDIMSFSSCLQKGQQARPRTANMMGLRRYGADEVASQSIESLFKKLRRLSKEEAIKYMQQSISNNELSETVQPLVEIMLHDCMNVSTCGLGWFDRSL